MREKEVKLTITTIFFMLMPIWHLTFSSRTFKRQPRTDETIRQQDKKQSDKKAHTTQQSQPQEKSYGRWRQKNLAQWPQTGKNWQQRGKRRQEESLIEGC